MELFWPLSIKIHNMWEIKAKNIQCIIDPNLRSLQRQMKCERGGRKDGEIREDNYREYSL